MIKNLIFRIQILFILSLTNCSGNSFHYVKYSPAVFKESPKYHVESVLLELSTKSKKRIFANYPTQEKLTEIIRESFIKKLQEKDIYSANKNDLNNFALDVKIKYKRIGIIYSKTAYHSFRISHEITIINRDGEIIAKSIMKNYKAPRNLFFEYISNIKILFAKKGPEDEIEDLDIALEEIVNRLKKFGKTR